MIIIVNKISYYVDNYKNEQEGVMSIKEIDNLFNSGMEQMRRGNFKEAEVLFEKAKAMTVDMQKK